MKTYVPPLICVEPLLGASAFMDASNEGYEIDQFDPDFIMS